MIYNLKGTKNYRDYQLLKHFSYPELRFYIYAKIKNRGVKTYTGKGKGLQYLNGFWARASMFQNRETWFGYYDRDDGSIFPGDIIGYNRLTEPIAPGESRIFKNQRYVTDSLLLSDSILPMCVMGYITGQRYEMKVEVDSLEIIKVWDSDKLIQNNMIKIEDNKFPFTAKILNARNIPVSMRVDLEREKELSDLLSHTDLSILTNLSGVKSDVNVRPSSGASKLPTFKTVRYKGNTVILPKFDMQPREEGEITVDCSYRADEAITERKTYDVNLVLIDDQSGLRLGGETFRIVQNPRPAILPSVNVISNSSNKATLSVGNVAENARYEWYDKDGNSLGTGSTINVPVSANLSQYKVKVIADKDGAYNYAEANLTGTQSIKNVESGRNETSVAFSEATDCNAKLQLSSVSGSVPTKEYTVAKGIQTYDIPTSELRNGVYQVSLIENGQVIDTKKFVK